MLLIDKYNIKDKYDIVFHYDLYNKVIDFDNKDKNKFNSLPNILVYGNKGVGKKSFVKLLLKEMYNENVHNIKKETYSIREYNNKKTDHEVYESDYHLIIQPCGTGFDKYIIEKIVKKYAMTRNVLYNGNDFKFKTIYIKDVDNLSYYAQTSLRCTMEKYVDNCKFILEATDLLKVIEPLRSRCLPIRFPAPTTHEIVTTLFKICCMERIDKDIFQLNDIAKMSKNNIKKAIWNLQFDKNGVNFEISWEKKLIKIVNYIYHFYKINTEFDLSAMNTIRKILYEIYNTNIDGTTIIKFILENLMKKIKNQNV